MCTRISSDKYLLERERKIKRHGTKFASWKNFNEVCVPHHGLHNSDFHGVPYWFA